MTIDELKFRYSEICANIEWQELAEDEARNERIRLEKEREEVESALESLGVETQ